MDDNGLPSDWKNDAADGRSLFVVLTIWGCVFGMKIAFVLLVLFGE